MTTLLETSQDCCPEFDPAPWDDKLIEWKQKKFLKGSVFTLFYMPVNFGRVMRNMDKIVTQAGEKLAKDRICLSDHTSKWNMDVYLSVDKEIPGVENTTLNGKYYCKVYEGPYRDTEKWRNDFEKALITKQLKQKKSFMWFTTCPKCAKKYGKNYVALISQVN